MDIY
jgi:hypothetical protein